MAGYNVMREELLAASSEIRDDAADIATALKQLDGDVDALLGSGWTSGASRAFRAAWAEWQSAASSQIASLESEANALAETARLYEGTEDGVTNVVRSAQPWDVS